MKLVVLGATGGTGLEVVRQIRHAVSAKVLILTVHESDQIVTAMHARDLPVVYVVYPDEGHGFARPENRMSFNAIAEAFLAAHLGGRAEPIGADFAGAKFEVGEGASHVPGLEAALTARA
jgi:hypothetical protein